MSKRILILVTIIFIANFSFSQSDNPNTAAFIVIPDYAAPLTETGFLLNMTSAGPTNCGTISTDDVFYQFTATAPGAEFNLNSTQFDGVLELWDDGYNSLDCSNNSIGLGPETLWYTQLITGNTYFIRVHSSDGNSGLGEFTLEYNNLPTRELAIQYRTTSVDGDNYRVFDFLRRTIETPIEASVWKFRNTTTNATYIYEISNDFYQLSINNVELEAGTLANPFFCYGYTYEVSIEAVIEGQGCGYGTPHDIVFQDEPNTELSAPYISAFLNPNADFISATNTSLDQVMEWEISEFGNFLESILTAEGQNRLYLNTSANILFNRAYEIRVRVNSCGEQGPWSEQYQIFTTDIPYTSLIPGTCNGTFNNGSGINCIAIPLASGYYWQVAPILLDDPTYTPIGPSLLFESSASAVTLSGLEPNSAYRISVKPIFANGAQVGEYGPFCQIGTAGSGVSIGLEDNDNSSESFSLQSAILKEIKIYPNPITGDYLQIRLLKEDVLHQVSIFSAIGELVLFETILTSSSIDVSDLKKGNYYIQILSDYDVLKTKIIIN